MTTAEILIAIDRFGTASKDYGVAIAKTPGFTHPHRTVMLEARDRLIAALVPRHVERSGYDTSDEGQARYFGDQVRASIPLSDEDGTR